MNLMIHLEVALSKLSYSGGIRLKFNDESSCEIQICNMHVFFSKGKQLCILFELYSYGRTNTFF